MPPLNLLIKPASGRCNMRCRYCFYADETAHREVDDYGLMPEDVLEADPQIRLMPRVRVPLAFRAASRRCAGWISSAAQ